MDIMPNSYLPGDPMLVDKIVYQLKSQGIFDQFRKECIADVDTKPAYQNLRQRVEGSVTNFLRKQKWQPDMNKNQVREMLRKNIQESGFLETGVERIVDQVVNPKITSIFQPKVAELVYKYLGIEQPKEEDTKMEELQIKTENLLPTDLEAVSPDSVTSEKKAEKTDTTSLNDSKIDEDESPPFEPIEQTSNVVDENSVDSHMSGFSGLLSHDSVQEQPKSTTEFDQSSNQDTKMSCDGQLSSVVSEDNDTKMEICEDSLSKSMDSNTKHFSFNMDSSDKSTSSVNADKKEDKPKEKDDKKDKDRKDKKERDRKDSSRDKDHSRERTKSEDSKHKSRSDSNKDKKDDKKCDKDKYKSSKDSSKDKYRDKDKDKKESSDRSKSNDKKERSDKEKDKDRKSSSSRHSTSSSSKDKSSSSSSKKETSSSSSTSKDRSGDKSRSSSSSHSKDVKKDGDKSKGDHRKHSSSGSSSSKKDDNRRSSSSSSKKDNHSSKDKDKKDKSKKDDPKDDHFSLKGKKSERRSTDRDSNDGNSTHRSSSVSESNSSIQNQSKSQDSIDSSNSGSTDSGGNSEAMETRNDSFDYMNPTDQHVIKWLKPKVAENIHEAKRLKKIRKHISELEHTQKKAFIGYLNDESHKENKNVNLDDNVKAEEAALPSPPLQSAVVSAASWDEMEAKLNQFNYNTYGDYSGETCTPNKQESSPKQESSSSPLQNANDDSCVEKDDEMCRYFDVDADNKDYFAHYQEIVGKIMQKLQEDIDFIAFNARHSNSISLTTTTDGLSSPLTDSNMSSSDLLTTTTELRGTKRKLCLEETSDLHNNNKNRNSYTIEENQFGKFPLPLSPAESDKSIDVKVRKSSCVVNKGSSQRYSSDDLYKPRPSVRGSRRRGKASLE